MWRLAFVVLTSAAGLVRAQTAAAPAAALPATTLPEGYAGSDTCGVCHEDIARAFRQNPHGAVDNGRSKAFRAARWNNRACESCHGAGKEHAESADPTKIFRFKGAAASRANQHCLSCHAGQETHSGRLFGSHNRNQLACTSCHTVHHATQRALLASAPEALCESCHVSVKAEFNRPFRHKLQEGAIACVDCHNPHGELPPRSLRRVAANDLTCVKCHGDKRGPFTFEHVPMRLNNCSTCHEPHGSANPRMLVRHDVSLLCLECHTSTVQRLGVTPPAFHDLRNARFRNCTICHSKIHGSFVNKEFLR